MDRDVVVVIVLGAGEFEGPFVPYIPFPSWDYLLFCHAA